MAAGTRSSGPRAPRAHPCAAGLRARGSPQQPLPAPPAPAHPPRLQLRCAQAPENRREGTATHRFGRSRRLCRRQRGGSGGGGSAFPPPASPWTVPPPAAPPSPASPRVSLPAAADAPSPLRPRRRPLPGALDCGDARGPSRGARFAGAVDAPPAPGCGRGHYPRSDRPVPARGPGF